MIPKQSKPVYKKLLIKGAAVLFVAEAAAFVGSYGIWHKLNTDREFRKTVHHNYPYILDLYYKFSEKLGDSNIRQIDYEYWNKQSK